MLRRAYFRASKCAVESSSAATCACSGVMRAVCAFNALSSACACFCASANVTIYPTLHARVDRALPLSPHRRGLGVELGRIPFPAGDLIRLGPDVRLAQPIESLGSAFAITTMNSLPADADNGKPISAQFPRVHELRERLG